jgi:hypothetical protein
MARWVFDHLFKRRRGVSNRLGAALLVPHQPTWPGRDDAVFVGDTLLFMPMWAPPAQTSGGNAHALFRSVQNCWRFPVLPAVRCATDCPPAARSPAWELSARSYVIM